MLKINKKLLILGAGGHGKVCADCAEAMGVYSKIAFLDDNLTGGEVMGYKVIGGFDDINMVSTGFDEFFVAIGNNRSRILWLEKLIQKQLRPAILIHSDAIVSKHAKIMSGCVVLAGAVVNASAILNEGVIINTRAVVEHDCILGKGVHVSSGALIAGGTQVGENTWICIGAKISNNLNIGKNTIIAANSTVIKDIGDNVMAVGTPAKVKKVLE